MKRVRQQMLNAAQAGFTIVEILVVVVIIGILATMIIPKLASRPEQARIVKVKQDLLTLQNAMDLYKLDNGIYPSTEQGLEALVNKPSSAPIPRNYKSEGYLQDIPEDPWGEAYQYRNLGDRARVFSFGPKGREGGEEIDAKQAGKLTS